MSRTAFASVWIFLAAASLVVADGVAGRATPVAHADPISLVPVATGLSSPVGLVHAGDGSGRLFIVEQTGRIKVLSGGTVMATPFLDISGLVTCCGEQGLLGLAFDPDYETNGYFYVDYIDAAQNTVVARYQVSANPNVANAGSATTLISEPRPATNHNGGQLAFGPDGYLYVGMGDSGGGGDPGDGAEDVNSLLGKIWRLDVDNPPTYVAATNPLVGPPGRDEIWAYGLRNPWRFSFDRLTGDLFIADVGQGSREEIDFQPAGDTTLKNYGWDVTEGTACYEPPAGCNTAGITFPILEYGHSSGNCSVTGGYRYRGSASPALYAAYIYGDYCSGRIWSAALSGSSWTATQLTDSPYLISSFGEDEAGELYVVHLGGAIYRIATDGDGDTVPDAADNCPATANASQTDTDGDELGDACEALFGASGSDPDSDDDGCRDGIEARPLTFAPAVGGDRDPADPWDFFDVTADAAVDLSDTLDVLAYFGDGGLSPAGNLRDRDQPFPSKPWRSGEADDGVDLTDALVSLDSFGHDCS